MIREELKDRLFPFVIKPGRYSGGEPGQIIKNHEGKTRYLHAYPDKYEIGQSYVGLQTLYHLVNSDDRFLCERVYAVDLDADKIMRREKIPLFSIETSTPAKEFDAFGFTLVDETVFTNILSMLDLSSIPLRSADRDETDPIIMAGGPAVYNPEPLADFIDLFFIGDAEDGLTEILSIIHENREKSKLEKLELIAREVTSVYIPRFYDNQLKPIVDFAPSDIIPRVVSELKPEYFPTHPIVPLVETIHNHLSVEIMRGCPQGCKFCMAGPIYRPVRPRTVDEIVNQIDIQLKSSGHNSVSLLSLSTTDYPYLDDLIKRIAGPLNRRRVALSVPSLRPGSISPEIFNALRTIKKSGLTIAPEAGSERLRLFIRKEIPDAAIYDTVKIAFSKGWTTIKLYFMVGLPTETDEDLLAIAKMANKIFEISRLFTGKANINVHLSPFVPKAHTPLQWDAVGSEEEVFEKIKFVRKNIRSGQIRVKHNSTQLAMLSTMIGRGGREMVNVIETAYKKGCRFDSWSEHFQYDKWLEALSEHSLSLEKYQFGIPFDKTLPWSHIKKGVSRDRLVDLRKQSSTQLKDFKPKFVVTEDDIKPNQPPVAFGRSKKKVLSQSGIAPTKNKVRIRWGKTERYRYMSHLENLYFMERAIRQAELPVAYSQGFNQSMKLSLGPPLPLGFTSEAEYIDIYLEENLNNLMIDRFIGVLPDGISLIEARSVLDRKKSLNALLNRADYAIPVKLWKDQAELKNMISKTLAMNELICDRSGKAGKKEINLRPAVYDIKIEDDMLIATLGLGEGGYAKPQELTGFLSNGLQKPIAAIAFHRKSVYRINDFGDKIEAMDL